MTRLRPGSCIDHCRLIRDIAIGDERHAWSIMASLRVTHIGSLGRDLLLKHGAMPKALVAVDIL